MARLSEQQAILQCHEQRGRHSLVRNIGNNFVTHGTLSMILICET